LAAALERLAFRLTAVVGAAVVVALLVLEQQILLDTHEVCILVTSPPIAEVKT